MESKLKVTAQGKKNGWTYMHLGGWVINPESRYVSDYTPATREELEIAKRNGDFEVEYGENVYVGGIMYDWVPAETFFCYGCEETRNIDEMIVHRDYISCTKCSK